MSEAVGSTEQDAIRAGYLELVELPGERGFRAGLLVINEHGYPLEFYCTTPIRPTKTQRLLYGTALRPYIVCQLLGRTLLHHLKLHPMVLFVSDPTFLAMRPVSSIPIVCLSAEDETLPPWVSNSIWKGRRSRLTLVVHGKHSDDAEVASEVLDRLQDYNDPLEPLQRIRSAIEQTSGVTRSPK